jgi:hypothetical protein
MTNYVEVLNTIADTLQQKDVDSWVESVAIREAANYIRKLERSLDLYEQERIRFRHAKPEMTGAYFISGESGYKDDNLLPEYIWVCPAYGCGWSQRYVKTDKASGPEW